MISEDHPITVGILKSELRQAIHELQACLPLLVPVAADVRRPVSIAEQIEIENHIRQALALLPGWLLEPGP